MLIWRKDKGSSLSSVSLLDDHSFIRVGSTLFALYGTSYGFSHISSPLSMFQYGYDFCEKKIFSIFLSRASLISSYLLFADLSLLLIWALKKTSEWINAFSLNSGQYNVHIYHLLHEDIFLVGILCLPCVCVFFLLCSF